MERDDGDDIYIQEIEFKLHQLEQRHDKLVDACKAWRKAREKHVCDEPPIGISEANLISDLIDEEPIND